MIPRSAAWWLGLAIFCVVLEAIALYYQYVLGQLPCVLCIHVRMLLFLLLILSVLGFFTRKLPGAGLALMVPVAGAWAWMVERSYQLLGTERGWIMGECQMQSGLPDWLALERWMPWLFEIHEPCGYTPFVLFRITMAEMLIVISVIFLVVCLGILAAGLGRKSPHV